jgi:hypothetical protein
MRAWITHNERVNMKYLRRGKRVEREGANLFAVVGALCYLAILVLVVVLM